MPFQKADEGSMKADVSEAKWQKANFCKMIYSFSYLLLILFLLLHCCIGFPKLISHVIINFANIKQTIF